jgi:hypothetical protein
LIYSSYGTIASSSQQTPRLEILQFEMEDATDATDATGTVTDASIVKCNGDMVNIAHTSVPLMQQTNTNVYSAENAFHSIGENHTIKVANCHDNTNVTYCDQQEQSSVSTGSLLYPSTENLEGTDKTSMVDNDDAKESACDDTEEIAFNDAIKDVKADAANFIKKNCKHTYATVFWMETLEKAKKTSNSIDRELDAIFPSLSSKKKSEGQLLQEKLVKNINSFKNFVESEIQLLPYKIKEPLLELTKLIK